MTRWHKRRSSGIRRGASAGRRAGMQPTVQPPSASAAPKFSMQQHSSFEAPALSSASGRQLLASAAAEQAAISPVSEGAAPSSNGMLQPGASAGQLAGFDVSGIVPASEQHSAAAPGLVSSFPDAASSQKQVVDSGMLPESETACAEHTHCRTQTFTACIDLFVSKFACFLWTLKCSSWAKLQAYFNFMQASTNFCFMHSMTIILKLIMQFVNLQVQNPDKHAHSHQHFSNAQSCKRPAKSLQQLYSAS